MEKFKDECGVVAAYLHESVEAARTVYFGLNGIQHRGQESCGIAVSNDGQISCYKNDGLVTDVFNENILALLKGRKCIGHVNCSIDKSTFSAQTQPFAINYAKGSIAVAYNGGLMNADELRRELEERGAIFTSTSNSETIAYIIAQNDKGDLVDAVKKVVEKMKGGYAFCILAKDKIIGVRDPLGIRPLCLGKSEAGYFLSSESCGIDLMGGHTIRDVTPGEIVVIDDSGITSHRQSEDNGCRARCMFEYVYFSRPDSTIDERNVFAARELAGRLLAQEKPVEADVVLGVPDSGTPAAVGYAMESGIPYSASMIKNKYIGRTYIVPNEDARNLSVKIKLNPIKDYILGKRVVIVDDSIVRGTTMRNIISSIRELGALAVHLRISSPPVFHTCYFGVQTPDKKDLVANKLTKQEFAELLGADSLEYLSVNGLVKSAGDDRESYCVGCFTGKYPEL